MLLTLTTMSLKKQIESLQNKYSKKDENDLNRANNLIDDKEIEADILSEINNCLVYKNYYDKKKYTCENINRVYDYLKPPIGSSSKIEFYAYSLKTQREICNKIATAINGKSEGLVTAKCTTAGDDEPVIHKIVKI